MTPDEVLAQIDHAVEDWSVSEDAMRWLPEADDEWASANPPYRSGGMLGAPARVFVTSDPAHRSGRGLEGWTELGYTTDGATFTYTLHRPDFTDYRAATRPRPPITVDVRDAAADWDAVWRRANPAPPDLAPAREAFAQIGRAAQRLGFELQQWQVRVLAAYAPRLEEAQRVTEELSGPEQDPDKPGRALRRARGRDAQRSPYGPRSHR